MNTKKKIRSMIWTLFPAVFLVLFVVKTGNITSTSMEPLLEKGDKVIINRLSYVVSEPKIGDVVAFRKDGKLMIKRIVAGPGDVAASKDGSILLNEYVLTEPYLKEHMETDFRYTMEVPEGHYLVLGDNREESIDARFWKSPYISKEDILGRVVYSFAGFHRKSIERYELVSSDI